MNKINYIRPKSLRTNQQSKAMHLLFGLIADELNDRGLYISNVIKADAPWDKARVKELIWRTTQKKMFNKESTTQLTTDEVDKVFEVINRALGELGVDTQFPSINQIIETNEEKTDIKN